MQTQANLTPKQQTMYREILEESLRDNTPVRDLIPLWGGSRRDQAAVAEEFTPGAGQDYL